jgi:hypothetical protein
MYEDFHPTPAPVGDTAESPLTGICPACGRKGKKVDTATVKSMLAVSLRLLQDTQYLFCQESDCEVVYFSEDGLQAFRTAEVRERVYQKEPHSGSVLICYCFRHSLDALRQDLLKHRTSTLVDDIHNGIAAGQCACDWRNPQGTCCLGNVLTVLKQMESALIAGQEG